MTDNGSAPDLPKRPTTAAANKAYTPPPSAPPVHDAAMLSEQARMLKEYEDKQAALVASQQAEERARLEREARQQREFEEAQRQQAERERLAQEQLLQEQMNMQQYSNQYAASQAQELEREILGMRGQYERDQLMLEQYDRVYTPCYFNLRGSATLTLSMDRL